MNKRFAILINEYVASGKVYLVHHDCPGTHTREKVRWPIQRRESVKPFPGGWALYDNQAAWEDSGDLQKYVAAAMPAADFKRVQSQMKGCEGPGPVAGASGAVTYPPNGKPCPIDAYITPDIVLGTKVPVNATPTFVITYKGKRLAPGRAEFPSDFEAVLRFALESIECTRVMSTQILRSFCDGIIPASYRRPCFPSCSTIFIVAAIAKMKPQPGMPWTVHSINLSLLMFSWVVDSYQILPSGMVTLFAQILPPFELFLGIWLLSGIALRLSSVISALLMCMFVIALASAFHRGLGINCGCFGQGIQVAVKTELIRVALFSFRWQSL